MYYRLEVSMYLTVRTVTFNDINVLCRCIDNYKTTDAQIIAVEKINGSKIECVYLWNNGYGVIVNKLK